LIVGVVGVVSAVFAVAYGYALLRDPSFAIRRSLVLRRTRTLEQANAHHLTKTLGRLYAVMLFTLAAVLGSAGVWILAFES